MALQPYSALVKRPGDALAALLALVLLAPVMAIAWLAIRLEDGGPAIFAQTRVGHARQPFVIYKFRSMPLGTGDLPSAAARALAVTRVGAFIRRTNIDELPQLWNILVGDMSFVGPRPALPSQHRLIELRTAGGAYEVRPGLTGLAQVSSYDGMPEDRKAEFDIRYAREISFVGDLNLVVRTFVYLLRRPPVY